MYWGGVVSLLLLGTSVYASTIIQATSINYVDTDNLGATNVQDALDKISTKATKKIEEAKKECPKGSYCKPVLCKRATSLHTEKCENTDTSGYCLADGYSLGDAITYGSLGTKGTLTNGDAFDCDVNGDGVYNEATERFYYLGDLDDDTAMLIYYSNVDGANPTSTVGIAYDESSSNNNGPVTAIKQLPTVEQWKNVNLKNISRTITNEIGTNIASSGTLPTTFSYNGYAARLLAIEDLKKSISNYGTFQKGILKQYSYYMESTQYSSNNKNDAYGYWLENAHSSKLDMYKTNMAMLLFTEFRGIYAFYVDSTGDGNSDETGELFYGKRGVRPVIEVAKTNISY